LLRHGFTEVDTFFRIGGVDPTPAEISASINEGLLFIDYRGWAGSDGWWEPPYTRTDVAGLTNSQAYPVVTSIVCGTGDYAAAWTDPCFGEAWIRAGSATNPHGGVAFYGTTDHDTNTRYNNPINSGFYQALFDLNLPFIGQAVWYGKAECFRLHPWEYEHIGLYFHTYQLLGDPGLMQWRGIPGELEVSHDALTSGALCNFNVSSGGEPVEGACVAIYRPFSGLMTNGYTDFDGRASIAIPGEAHSDLIATIVAPFHIPVVETVYTATGLNFVFEGFSLDDTSDGDGDGVLEPGETAELTVSIHNTSSSGIRRMEAYLGCEHPGITIDDEFDTTDSRFWTGTTAEFEFSVSANGSAVGGGPAKMTLLLDSRISPIYFNFELPLRPGSIIVDSLIFTEISGDGDNIPDPGEEVNLAIKFINNGDFPSEPMQISLSPNSGFISYEANYANVASIPASGSATSSPIEFSISSGAFNGAKIGLDIGMIFGYNVINETSEFILGSSSTSDPTGPDEYGYYAYDNTDISSGFAPIGSFIDISSTGTAISTGDDMMEQLHLPFPFVFYGESYDTLTVCSNGFAAPGIQPPFMVTFYNTPIPGPNGAWGNLAVFWDDLEPITSEPTSGMFYEYSVSENAFIVQWNHMQNARVTGMDNTFELVIYDRTTFPPTLTGDSEFEFRYNGAIADVDTEEEYSTVGIENANDLGGLEYLFSTIYDRGASPLGDNRAIKFTTNNGTARIVGTVTASYCQPEEVSINLTDGAPWPYDVLYFGAVSPDNLGRFSYRCIVPGTYTLECNAPFNFRELRGITFEANITDTEDFVLTPIPIPNVTHISKADSLPSIIIKLNLPPLVIDSLGDYPFELDRIDIFKYSAIGGKPDVISTDLLDTIFTDTSVQSGRKYWYRFRSVYLEGPGPGGYLFFSALSPLDSGWLSLPTKIEETDKPEKFSLAIAPNPFNPSLSLDVNSPQPAKLDFFDISGRKVYSTNVNSGSSKIIWNGSDFSGKDLPGGIYFIRLSNGEKVITRKAIFLK
jgi:hypothetical protein